MQSSLALAKRNALWMPVVAAFVAASGCANARGQNTAATPADRAAYESYALEREGDVASGRAIFSNPARSTCTLCHTVDGSGGRAGPDLSGIGDKFPRRELIRSILEPSSTIAVGYGTTTIERKSGGDVVGVIKQSTPEFVEIVGADSKPVRVPTNDIAEQRALPMSLMPEGLHASLSLQEFADLASYLQSLRRAGEVGAAEIPRARRGVRFERFFGERMQFKHPLWAEEIPERPGYYIVLEQEGRGWLVDKSSDTKTPFLDLQATIRRGPACGLLGVAFHPRFASNRKYYLNYQVERNGRITTQVVERKFAEDLKIDSGEPSRLLLEIPASTQDHVGGCLTFGSDGFLYIGMGDTGPQNDPQGHGQDLATLQGKLLRIDVDRADDGRPYAIPADNPLRDRSGARPEIWAYGFREPWRFTFDSVTKDLWLGDVGQNEIEEVSIVRPGENHGWNVIEGDRRFSERYRKSGETFTAPVFSYPHRIGVSVTGGYVYHGDRAPALKGWYIFADYESRRIWALRQTDRKPEKVIEIGRAPSRVASFMQDRDGELYIVGFDSGVIDRLALEQVDPTPLQSRIVAETAERGPVSWRYVLQQPASEGWQRPEFDDSQWKQSAGGFGTRGTPGAIVRTEWNTGDIWLRREFTAPAENANATSLVLRVHHDEDAEVFLNGVPTARLPRWTMGYVEVPVSPEAARALVPGKNVLAIHCHQNGGGQYIDAGLVEYTNAGDSEGK